MNRLIRIPVLLLVAVTSISGAQSKKEEVEVYDDAEGYAVLSLLLDHHGKGWANSEIQILSLSASEKQMSSHTLGKCVKVPDEFREAADDFNEKAKLRRILQSKFQMKVAYRVVEKPQLKTTHRKENDKEAGERISSGFYYVSVVGFDKDKSHAIAYIDYICGSLCGGGNYHLLKKGPDGWEEAKGISQCVWMY